jgi:hypothetical protein
MLSLDSPEHAQSRDLPRRMDVSAGRAGVHCEVTTAISSSVHAAPCYDHDKRQEKLPG